MLSKYLLNEGMALSSLPPVRKDRSEMCPSRPRSLTHTSSPAPSPAPTPSRGQQTAGGLDGVWGEDLSRRSREHAGAAESGVTVPRELSLSHGGAAGLRDGHTGMEEVPRTAVQGPSPPLSN